MQTYCIFWCCIVLPLRLPASVAWAGFCSSFFSVFFCPFLLDVRDSLMGFLIRHIPFDITVCCFFFLLLNFQQYHIILFFHEELCKTENATHSCVCVQLIFFCFIFDFVERPTQHYPLVAKISKWNVCTLHMMQISLSISRCLSLSAVLKFSCGQQNVMFIDCGTK